MQSVLSCKVKLSDLTAQFAQLYKLCPSDNRSVKLSLRSFQQDWVHILAASEFSLADVACRTKLQQHVTTCLDAEGYIHSKHAACKQKEGPNDT